MFATFIVTLYTTFCLVTAYKYETFQPLNRSTRQAGTVVCVPQGTCAANINGGGGGGGIDPRLGTRIVVPGGSCGSNEVACPYTAPSAPCGRGYVTPGTATTQVTYGSYPWMVYLEVNGQYVGGGILVDPMYVVTAAHKVNNQGSTGTVVMWFGVYDPNRRTSQAWARVSRQIRIHESFTCFPARTATCSVANLKNDIAVIQLNESVPIGYHINIGLACLPSQGDSTASNSRCIVAGWGDTSLNGNQAPTSPPKQVDVPIVDYNTCRNAMANIVDVATYLDVNEICAGGQLNKDACTKDGGSPLMCPNGNQLYSVGLVIWGKNCGQPNVYGVYVDLSKYRNWIDNTISSLNYG